MLQLTKRFEKLEQVSETFCIYFNVISISFLHIYVILPKLDIFEFQSSYIYKKIKILFFAMYIKENNIVRILHIL